MIQHKSQFTVYQGIKIYSKAVPQATFADIERKMREDNFNIYLIAMVRAGSPSHDLFTR